MIVNASELQQITSFVILAAVMAAGVKCSDHGADPERSVHGHEDAGMRIKAQSRISMTKGGYGARVQIREDLHGRRRAHAMAICDCNGQGPWRPLFKPSQILKTEFPEHESFHDDVDSQYRTIVGDHADNHLRPSALTDDRGPSGSDGGDGFGAGEVGGPAKKHNHMIHLHLIPHIYVPVVHPAGYSEAKNYHATVVEDVGSSAPSHDPSSEYHAVDVAAGTPQHGPSGAGENPTAADDHGNFNGHSGESPYFTVSGDAAVRQHHQTLSSPEHFDNAVDNAQHDYEAPSSSVSEEPHQYQVHEYDDLSKDYSNKKQVTSGGPPTTASKQQAQQLTAHGHHHHHQQQQQQPQSRLVLENKQRKAAVKSNRAKYGRTLTSRQDLKNLLVMRPPPMGQTQTWRYVYHRHQPTTARHQFYQMKPPLVPLFKTRTVPLILHIRQRSDD